MSIAELTEILKCILTFWWICVSLHHDWWWESRILKELALVVDVNDKKCFSARNVIGEAKNVCGEGNVLAVVPRS